METRPLVRRVLLAAAAVTLALTTDADCVLDQATLIHVRPSTVHVVASYSCGAVLCWRRWTEQDGKRIGQEGSACEAQGTSGGAAITVPTRSIVGP